MNRGVRITAIASGSIAALIAVMVATVQVASERKLHRTVRINVKPVAYATDAAALAHGRYLFESRGCAACHGTDGAGAVVIDDQKGGLYVKSPNITSGAGSATAGYHQGDWVRVIRHGVKPNGEPVLIMPSEDYARLTDDDVAALAGYVRSLPATPGEPTRLRLPLLVRALYATGAIRDAAEKIDHTRAPAEPVPIAVTAEHGAYVANMCKGCHGAQLSGGRIPGAPPHWPPAANLTPGTGSVMSRYDTADKFKLMMRSGKRPDGSEVSKVMPFASLRNIDDTDLEAVYAFLHTPAPVDAGHG